MAQIRPGQLQENVLYNISASYAISASHEITKEVSSSYADFAESSSYAVTASYLDNYVEPFPYTGSAQITGSLGITGSLDVTGGITGSLLGTASFSTTALSALNTPFAVITASNADANDTIEFLKGGGATFAVTVNNVQDAVSSSYALTASYLDSYVPPFPFVGDAVITGSLQISSSTNQQLTLIGSGSSQPIFRVQGSAGELFSITDSLSGSLFAVNNISGLPILEVFSDDRIIQGDYAAPMLTTTVKNTISAVGAFTVYELPTASYDGAFFEYTARSGSNARAGQIMSIWSGSQVNFTETTTTDFGSTTGLAFTMIVTGSNFALTGSVTTADWTIKTIVRSI